MLLRKVGLSQVLRLKVTKLCEKKWQELVLLSTEISLR